MEIAALPDPLEVRASTAAVMAAAAHVRIAPEAVDALAAQWVADGVQAPEWSSKYHFFDGSHRSANWLLALDAVNYCFWSEDPTQRWEIDYKGERLNGYWALAACMKRAVEEQGVKLWDAKRLAEIEQGDVYRIFRGSALSTIIPMVGDRLTCLREVGQVLLDKYDGQFANVIHRAKGDAAHLAALIALEFPSFNDVSTYGDHEAYFYKRAQLLVTDLWGAFGGKGLGAITGLESLTAFADYKLPQILREHAVLEYSDELAAVVDARQIIPPGSVAEVEIRAATVQAVEALRSSLATRGIELHAFQVDWLLWQQAQSLQMQRPYHLTRTIYY